MIFAGSQYKDRSNYAEVQVWRRNDENMYESVAFTMLEVPNQSSSGIYSVTSQMPFKQDDVLGVFLPSPNGQVQLRVLFTDQSDSTGYYIAANSRPARIPLMLAGEVNVLPLIQVEISK